MSSSALKLFLEMFEDYCRHFKDNPDSVISKILGVFTVKSSKMGAIHIMLMENALRFKESENIKYIFDLKGSKVDRKVKGQTKNTTTLKDINYLMVAEKSKGLTMMHPEIKCKLKRVIKKDVQFLKSHGLMDYSLLLGIEKK